MALSLQGFDASRYRSARLNPSLADTQAAAKMQEDLRALYPAALPRLQNMLFGGGNPVQVADASGRTRLPASRSGNRVLDVARSQLGVRERTGRNDGVPAERYANGRREPWCADFVSWAHRQAGKTIPGNQRSLASVQHMEDQMKRNGMFHRGTPQPGDVIFFRNRGGSDRGSGRHVGIVERVANGRVHTIEGNSGNMVRRRSYPLGLSRISGYGRVP
jgi:cell wall-associated NlpC family hydrolase